MFSVSDYHVSCWKLREKRKKLKGVNERVRGRERERESKNNVINGKSSVSNINAGNLGRDLMCGIN